MNIGLILKLLWGWQTWGRMAAQQTCFLPWKNNKCRLPFKGEHQPGQTRLPFPFILKYLSVPLSIFRSKMPSGHLGTKMPISFFSTAEINYLRRPHSWSHLDIRRMSLCLPMEKNWTQKRFKIPLSLRFVTEEVFVSLQNSEAFVFKRYMQRQKAGGTVTGRSILTYI